METDGHGLMDVSSWGGLSAGGSARHGTDERGSHRELLTE